MLMFLHNSLGHWFASLAAGWHHLVKKKKKSYRLSFSPKDFNLIGLERSLI